MPTVSQLDESDMDIVVAGTADNIIMVEGGCARDSGGAIMIAALEFAMGHIREIVAIQQRPGRRAPARPSARWWRRPTRPSCTRALERRVPRAGCARRSASPARRRARRRVDRISTEAVAALKERFTEQEIYIGKILHDLERDELRDMVLREGVRADGRGVDDIRPITIEVGALPRTHGSCLFTRGETQALAVATLGTKSDEQRVEELEGQSWKSYMLHYNFPPFSVGEVRPIRGPGRREIGHGALAERAIEPVIPADTHVPVHDPAS